LAAFHDDKVDGASEELYQCTCFDWTSQMTAILLYQLQI